MYTCVFIFLDAFEICGDVVGEVGGHVWELSGAIRGMCLDTVGGKTNSAPS